MKAELALVIALTCSAAAQAMTVDVASPYGPAEVAAAFTVAADGDTVRMPATGGPYTWSSSVTLSSAKCLTLDLNGREISLSGVGGTIIVRSHASCLNRVTNGTVRKTGTGYADYAGPFQIRDTPGSYGVRVDHITFRGSGLTLADGTYLAMNGQGPGVMDHCTFLDMEPPAEFIHIEGWGAGNPTGWGSNVDKGGRDLFTYEDNTFTNAHTGGGGNNVWIQGYYGARVAVRFNTFNFVAFDTHGTPGMVGMRWWEVYRNAFNHLHPDDNNTYQLNFRAGSGIVFDNVGSSGSHTTHTGMCEEDTGYPAAYQIGRGTNQTSDPAMYFGNTTLSLTLNGCDAPEQPNMVAFDRDVYSSTSASCTSGGACTTGVGTGVALPTTCTTGVGFWKTDVGGNWNTTSATANDGALFRCTASNTWSLVYTPLQYPHPLTATASLQPPLAPTALRAVVR